MHGRREVHQNVNSGSHLVQLEIIFILMSSVVSYFSITSMYYSYTHQSSVKN